MRIAINTRFLLTSKMEGFGWYTYEISKRLVEMHPEHEFFFFFDRPFDEKFIFGRNVTPIVLRPPARHPILFYIWFEWSVKRALKKHKIDLFFSPDGYLSLGSSVRQIGVIHDLNFEHFPKDVPWVPRTYLKYFFPKFAHKAEKIITVSQYSKDDIVKTYNIDPSKIHVAWNGASDKFIPLSDKEKTEVRNEICQGEEYFLFVGAIHPRKNVTRLLQAFEKFKKETNSSVKLVIVGTPLWKNAQTDFAISEKIKSEIIFTGHLSLDELAKIMGAAKIFCFVPYFEGFGIPLVEAMKCGTPILSGNLTSLPEVAGDAALYCYPMNVEDIASKMIALNNDELLRMQLSEKGIQRSKEFDWNKSAEAVSKVLFNSKVKS